jgi:ABC-2 type transport system permease protein
VLKIYQRLWQLKWADIWQYRANNVMYLLYSLVAPVVYLAVWRSVAQSQGDVSGLTANDFTAYYMILLIVDQFTLEITIHILAYKIQDGTLSSELLRPIHPILTRTLMENLAFKTLNSLALIPVWSALYFLFRPDFSAVTLANVLLVLPILLLGFALNFLIGAIITCVAFWTTRIYSLADLTYAPMLLLGGTFVPLELLPGFAETLARLLPFQLFLYFPIQLILGRLEPVQIAQNSALLVGWLIIAMLGFRWIWREGVKRYSAVGA